MAGDGALSKIALRWYKDKLTAIRNQSRLRRSVMNPEFKPMLDVLEARVLPSTGGTTPGAGSGTPSSVFSIPNSSPAPTSSQPTVVPGSAPSQVFGFPLTATATGQSIEPSNEVTIDDLFQTGNLDVFEGPTAQVRANPKTVVPASVGSTSVVGFGVIPQPGSAYDPYAYSALRPVKILGSIGDPVPPEIPRAAPVPRAPLTAPPPERPTPIDGAAAAMVPIGAALVAVKPTGS
jgi:hypothetical protein